MTEETKRIVEWLRHPGMQNDNGWMADSLADAIERGDHLKDKSE